MQNLATAEPYSLATHNKTDHILPIKVDECHLENIVLNHANHQRFIPISQRIKKIQYQLQKPHPNKYGLEYYQLVNQIIRLFIIVGKYDYARNVTNNYLQRCGDPNPDCLNVNSCHMNLVRIDRKERKYFAALHKINSFYKPEITSKRQLKYGLIERIKLYLQTHSHQELLNLGKKYPESFPMMQEAVCIGLANSGEVDEALTLLGAYSEHKSPYVSYIFKLRKLELNFNIGREIPTAEYSHFYEIGKCRLLAPEKDIRDLQFCTHLAGILYQANKIDDGLRLFYQCLEFSQLIEDDLFKAVILAKINGLSKDQKLGNIIETMLINHYYHCRHYKARKLMLNSFPELEHVEAKNNDSDLDTIFNKISEGMAG